MFMLIASFPLPIFQNETLRKQRMENNFLKMNGSNELDSLKKAEPKGLSIREVGGNGFN